jgi:hypothetical protein
MWWGDLTTVFIETSLEIHHVLGKSVMQNDGVEAALPIRTG